MPRVNVHTIPERELQPDPIARADKFFNEHIGIHKLLVVDDEDRLRGLFTLSDIERITQEKAAPLKPARDAIPAVLRRRGIGDPELDGGIGPGADPPSRRRAWWNEGSMSLRYPRRTGLAKEWGRLCV